jgi:hypothetical protein
VSITREERRLIHHAAGEDMEETRKDVEHIAQFFTYAHLESHLQEVSKPFGVMAEQIITQLPRNPERTVALRKLLEAKDAAVRAFLAKG